ncbi:MAG: hypothetical protein HON98_10885 [Chloroflexi bacterium]|jgi:hypothetical protein|nr:hypothetical protein [Chloroflexota bacterium]MBT3668617.1 hypothetical protein [Chloroflexota bacterium]MBT4003130.1 hypothetical protein [Chloroflexota bacterium]MBT4306238.1 hypothetical protein [Chloroflexota bacterium]MBT4532881.1 hypothetical protein [Chloroflexota bacterium]
MIKKRRLFKLSLLVLTLIILLPASIVSAQTGDDPWEYEQASCLLIDHNWFPAEYPHLNASEPHLITSLTLSGFGFTFNTDYVEPGSTWTVYYNDMFELETTVDQFGRAMVYFGLWSYGTYPYTSTLVAPGSTEVMDGPSGNIIVDALEFLECSLDFLPHYIAPATNTPQPIQDSPPTNTITPEPSLFDDSPAIVEDFPDISVSDLGFFSRIADFLLSSWYIFCCCVILIVALIVITIVYFIRRRKRPQPDQVEELDQKLK